MYLNRVWRIGPTHRVCLNLISFSLRAERIVIVKTIPQCEATKATFGERSSDYRLIDAPFFTLVLFYLVFIVSQFFVLHASTKNFIGNHYTKVSHVHSSQKNVSHYTDPSSTKDEKQLWILYMPNIYFTANANSSW